MTDYSTGKVYLLYIPGLEEYGYVGSTVEELGRRLSEHKTTAKSDKVRYKFASACLFEEGNEVCIKLLEEYPCETKQQLLERERYWLDQYPEAVNKNPPILCEEERKEREKASHWKAYEKNKEHNLAKHREWLAANKEQQAEKRRQNRLANLEEARAKDREQREKRKEAANAHKKEKVECPICKKSMNRNSLSLHKKSVHSDS